MPLIHYIKDYNDLFFGELSLFEINGMRFVMRPAEGKSLGLQAVDVEVFPDFITHLVLSVDPDTAMLLHEYDIYVLDKAHLKPLGEHFAQNYEVVSIGGMARLLSFWEKGCPTKHRTLDDFYNNVTDEQREHYRY